MARQRTCPRGHRWDDEADLSPSRSTVVLCPVCGAALDPATAAGDADGTTQMSTLGVHVPPAPQTPAPTELPMASICSSAEVVATSLPAVTGYQLLGVLGQGGMGVVYRARQVGLNRLVALKMISGGSGEEALTRFRREAEAVAQLQHPNIVQVYETGEHEGRPFFSMELVDGGSLSRKIRKEMLPLREAADL